MFLVYENIKCFSMIYDMAYYVFSEKVTSVRFFCFFLLSSQSFIENTSTSSILKISSLLIVSWKLALSIKIKSIWLSFVLSIPTRPEYVLQNTTFSSRMDLGIVSSLDIWLVYRSIVSEVFIFVDCSSAVIMILSSV